MYKETETGSSSSQKKPLLSSKQAAELSKIEGAELKRHKNTNPALSNASSSLSSAEILKQNGDYYLEKELVSAAIKFYDAAIEKDANFIEAYVQRATAYSRIGEYGKAIADGDVVLKLAPTNLGALRVRSANYFVTKQYEKAIADLNIVIATNPNVSEPDVSGPYDARMRARVYFYPSGKVKAADLLADCNKLIELNFNLKYVMAAYIIKSNLSRLEKEPTEATVTAIMQEIVKFVNLEIETQRARPANK